MANYLARVELHDATEEEDYEELHAAMEGRGYLRQIQSDDGIVNQLPDATYVMQNTDVTLAVAHFAAVEAAEETGFEYSLIVVDFADWLATGLEPV